ncbi:MAG: hypothetical protein P4L82_01925 [Ancalomicrobiaceae bacterium]|nr:hypothetical protein [Ancalomicrobiaceae bacterium]
MKRIPGDIKSRLAGRDLEIPLGEETVHVKFIAGMESIRFSLRTSDPASAKIRQAESAAIVEAFFGAVRDDRPIALTRRQAVALSRDIYEAWCGDEPSGTYVFFDRQGFDPSTGDELVIADRPVIDAWKKYVADEKDTKCYVITKDPKAPVKYGAHLGIDPATGRECRAYTPQLIERLKEYEKGNRPKRVTTDDPTFFDLRTGEPVIWYSKMKDGDIELFDLMGFHPTTGDELLPVTKEVVDAWRDHQHAVKQRVTRPPQPIDPESYPFFDPLSGEPRVWYWHGADDRWEFYDNAGFHPRTGEPLTVISREAINQWQQAKEARARALKEEQQKRQEEQLRQQEELRKQQEELRKKTELELQQHQAAEAREAQARQEAAAHEAQLRQEAAAREAQARQAAEAQEAQRRQEAEQAREAMMKSADLCDRLAANPTDPQHQGDGTPYEVLKLQAKDAADACQKAVTQFPSEVRFQYQYARAIQVIDRQKAFELQKSVAAKRYPAAFDNLGWLFVTQRRDYAEAVRQFRIGTQLGDPDSMVSLAEMIDQKYYMPPDPLSEKLDLYKRAADLGHPAAIRAYNEELAKAEQQRQQMQQQQEVQKQMIGVFGTILNGAMRQR